MQKQPSIEIKSKEVFNPTPRGLFPEFFKNPSHTVSYTIKYRTHPIYFLSDLCLYNMVANIGSSDGFEPARREEGKSFPHLITEALKQEGMNHEDDRRNPQLCPLESVPLLISWIMFCRMRDSIFFVRTLDLCFGIERSCSGSSPKVLISVFNNRRVYEGRGCLAGAMGSLPSAQSLGFRLTGLQAHPDSFYRYTTPNGFYTGRICGYHSRSTGTRQSRLFPF